MQLPANKSYGQASILCSPTLAYSRVLSVKALSAIIWSSTVNGIVLQHDVSARRLRRSGFEEIFTIKKNSITTKQDCEFGRRSQAQQSYCRAHYHRKLRRSVDPMLHVLLVEQLTASTRRTFRIAHRVQRGLGRVFCYLSQKDVYDPTSNRLAPS